MNEHDIIIVGGGMVGLSLAKFIAVNAPTLTVLLVESGALGAQKVSSQGSFDDRSTALSRGSLDLLQRVGVDIEALAQATPILRVDVSDQGYPGKVNNTADDMPLGAVVPNRVIGETLYQEVSRHSNIHIAAQSQVVDVQQLQTGVAVTLLQGGVTRQETGRLLAQVDGAHSALQARLGVQTKKVDYGQHAFVFNIETALPHHGQAFERFTKDGPMAILPLGGDTESCRAAVVWTFASDRLSAMCARSKEETVHALQASFGFRLGRITQLGDIAQYHLQGVVAQEQVRRHWVLLGNAAHFLHPVAGQGFNLALRDCAALVELIQRHPQDYFELPQLERYYANQGIDQDVTRLLSDGLVSVFRHSASPIKFGRNLGLTLLDQTPSVKKHFFQQMMGKGFFS